MRGREFLMKDAYSFDLDHDECKKSYYKFFISYLKTFRRMGLKAIPMAAETGPIGGDLSHEFVIISDTGESDIYFDKRILSEDSKIEDVAYDNDLEQVVQQYNNYYTASDEKFDQTEFDNNVAKDQQTKSKGIEVGHIFSFGTKYSEAMKANVLTSEGKQAYVHMGSYGIGISRLVGAIIESSHDTKGIIWPNVVSPFDIGLINLKSSDEKINNICDDIYSNLLNENVDAVSYTHLTLPTILSV